jgi:predicted transposase
MQNLKFESKQKIGNKNLLIDLACFPWIQDNIYFICAPALDITGYGNSLNEAANSFITILDEFIDYTHKKNTFFDELENLGWMVNRKKKKFIAPDEQENNDMINELISEGITPEKSKLEMCKTTEDLISILKQYSNVVRYSYNRFLNGKTEKDIRELSKSLNSIDLLNSWLIQCGIKDGKAIQTRFKNEKVIFGKYNLINKLKNKITKKRIPTQ